MRILNLYAGIGGNRKLWSDEHEITAVELNPKIAAVYKQLYPNDKVVVGDAHKYLLEHYNEFDFIWASPPCPTHSQLGRLRVFNESTITGSHLSKARYPDMKLYEEILLLKHFFKGKYVVENVIAYYTPLIPPQELQRHHFWTNFFIPKLGLPPDRIENGVRAEWQENLGIDLSGFDLKGVRKDTVLRNCVHPVLGKHILDNAINPIPESTSLFK